MDMNGELKKLAVQFSKMFIDSPILSSEIVPPIITIMQDHFKKLQEIGKLLLPNLQLNNKTVAIFSDYGGGKGAYCFTYSFLVVSYDNLGLFLEKVKEIRKKYGLDDPWVEISFKDLRYGPLKRALQEYLIAANNLIPGLLFTIIIEKGVYSILRANLPSTPKLLKQELDKSQFGNWKKHLAEKLLRICWIISYLFCLLSTNSQKLLWVTDDEIVPNRDKIKEVREICGSINNYLFKIFEKNYEIFGFLVPKFFEDCELKKDLFDVLSITDLAAGSIEHFYTRQFKKHEETIKEEADKILIWLTEHGILLKKMSLIIKPYKNRWKTGILEFHRKDNRYFDFKYIYI